MRQFEVRALYIQSYFKLVLAKRKKNGYCEIYLLCFLITLKGKKTTGNMSWKTLYRIWLDFKKKLGRGISGDNGLNFV